ncbi:MAG: acyl-CoA dehydrogenase family protein [Pseudomonadota bacterium]
MNFLSPEQIMWRDSVERYVDKEIGREYIRKCDVDRQHPDEAFRKIAKMGWLKLIFPEDVGGDGMGILDYAVMIEMLSKHGVDFGVAITLPTFTAMNIALHGTPEQKSQYLVPFFAGEIRFAVSISEPGSGSDAANAKTRARRDGDHYVIDGQKLWCSGAGLKNTVILMLVRTDNAEDKRKGLSVLMIPNTTPGLTIRPLATLARRSITTTEIFLDNVRVPASQMLGKPGDGWQIIGGEHLLLERVCAAAGYMGAAQGAVTDALSYAQQRVQFGKPIFEFQVIRHMLADMQTQVDAARLLVYRAADMAAKQLDCKKEVAMAKLFASETLQTVSRQGIQIMGGYGTLPEYDMERHFREGMQATIGGGTSQIQRTMIAQEMRKQMRNA